jgi:outer membrane biosynthesis protein TonB
MAQRLNAAARDAALNRISLITAGVVALGLAGTVSLGVAVASATPDKTSKPVTNAAPLPEDETGSYDVTTPDVATVPAVPPKGQAAPKNPAPKTEAPKTKAPAPKPKPTTQPPVTSSGGS